MNKFIFLVINFVKRIIRLFFSFLNGGTKCIICGNQTNYFLICRQCIKTNFDVSKVLSVNRCKICGKELLTQNEICLQCRENPVLHNLDRLIPMFSYRLWNKELLFLWKIQSYRSLSSFFASLVNDLLKRLDIKYVVPVPPRPNKIKENGWDQIDELCGYLKFVYGFRVLSLLERKTAEQQKKLDRNSRLNSIGKSYCICDEKKRNKVLKNCGGRIPDEICIIDDVTTTGATLESCSEILKKMGVKKVFAVTLFIVD